MNGGRISPAVAVALLIAAIALVFWQFVFRRDDSMNFSTKDLPAEMKTSTPPASVSGVIPRRSPTGSATDFTGGATRVGGEVKGPPGRR